MLAQGPAVLQRLQATDPYTWRQDLPNWNGRQAPSLTSAGLYCCP